MPTGEHGFTLRRRLIAFGSALALAGPACVHASDCSRTAVGLVPLNDLQFGSYKDQQGGLYPAGSNLMPFAHQQGGLAQARGVVPRDAAGQPSPEGKIGLLAIGMSNASMHFAGFQQKTLSNPNINPDLVLVNGAIPGMTAKAISTIPSPTARVYWTTVDSYVSSAGLTNAQVQAAWLLEADANPSGDDMAYARSLASELAAILQIARRRFPNLRLAYLASRSYAGYSTVALNPEPYAYASGFSAKWVIESQITGNPGLNYDPSRGPVIAPWVAWGPYLWADGLSPRSDGLTWSCDDFADDGVHPSALGVDMVADSLWSFFSRHPTTVDWFLR
jgi:hypothetical protein